MRVIGTRELTASIINVTIASSIFVMPGTVAAGLGAAAPVAYLVCASLMALIALCFAAAGSRVSVTGGLYAYIDTAFGGFAGIYRRLSVLVDRVSVGRIGRNGICGIRRSLLAAAGRRDVARASCWSSCLRSRLVNIRGIKPGIRLIEAITAAKLVPLLVLIGVGVWSLNPDFLGAPMPTVSQVGQVSILLIFAFVGVEVALTPSGEIRDSARTVPRAILERLVDCNADLHRGSDGGAGSAGTRAADVSRTPRWPKPPDDLLGDAGKVFLLAGGTISIFGYVAGDMLGTPRALLALARDGVLPPVVAKVHPRYRTPAVAIVIYACVVAAARDFEQLRTARDYGERVGAAAVSVVCRASYELQRRDVRMAGAPFTLPGGPAIQLAASVGHRLAVDAGDRARVGNSGYSRLAAASVYYVLRARFGRIVLRLLGFARRRTGDVARTRPQLTLGLEPVIQIGAILSAAALVDFVRSSGDGITIVERLAISTVPSSVCGSVVLVASHPPVKSNIAPDSSAIKRLVSALAGFTSPPEADTTYTDNSESRRS